MEARSRVVLDSGIENVDRVGDVVGGGSTVCAWS